MISLFFAEKKKFRYRFSEGSQNTQCELIRENAVRIEMSTWLGSPEADDERDLSQIKDYRSFPHVRDLFIKYNTIISSSAPVERLFSFASEFHLN